MSTNIMALFEYEDDVITAARELRQSGFEELSLMSPIPIHEADSALDLGKSTVRRFSLAGAIIGAISGFGIATFSALTFILPTAGRAIITVPPFLIIAYEMTILFGVLATLIGFFIVARLPAWNDAAYRVESNIDGFSLAVTVMADGDREAAEKIFRDAGAKDVSEEDKRI
jgi:molybdopterin-containing oxidoreductase family membrane subunit|tara:strand:- start:3941 stop:4453 length:513 start_codon:yes stop_codon:yes gene_type:complete